jgi:hypothetical protein
MSSQAAIIKYRSRGSLNNRHSFVQVLVAGKAKSRMWTDLVLWFLVRTLFLACR